MRGSSVLDSLDAAAVRRWYEWGLGALDATRDEINSLNVFPVADADTGTNLHLTLESAVGPAGPSAVLQADGEGDTDLAATAVSMARLSLLGARGSSGVILSQLLRGVAEVLAAERLPPRGVGLTRALERAVALAYAAVAQPVEGTMLTVARAAAEAARATGSDDLQVVVKAAVEAAHRALDETPGQLDVLSRAGVVDAGGRGVVVLLDVLQAVVEERPLPPAKQLIAHPRLDAIEPAAGPAYEVMYLVEAPDDRIPQLRAALDAIGDSVVVSGGGGLWTVHVHTDDSRAALEVAAPIGEPQRVRITPIAGHEAAQSEVRAGRHSVAVLLADDSPAGALRAVFAEAGAQVLSAGPAARIGSSDADADHVVVLTEATPAAVSAAESLAAQVVADGGHAEVVSARAAVQLLAALAAHDARRPFADDVAEMRAAVEATRCGEVSLSAPDPVAAACALVSRLAEPAAELVTVLAATDVGERIERQLLSENPGLDVVVVRADIGDQIWLGVE